MDPVVVVLLTFPHEEVARQVAAVLVDQRLAACVNVFPGVTSFYRWEGKCHQDAEVAAIVKTTRPLLESLKEAVRALHPYDCPEFIALPVEDGLPAYLDWVRDSVG